MDEKLETLLNNLLKMSKIDAHLAGIAAQKKELEKSYQEKKKALDSAFSDHSKKLKEYETKRDNYTREEKRLKEQQQKLVDRRKALSTLGSYKLQMSAEREITAASKQLASQEEVLLKNLDNLEELKKVSDAAKEIFEAAKKDFDTFTEEGRSTIENFNQRVKEYEAEKAAIVPNIDSRSLDIYKRLASRHVDPVVALKQNTCGGCFLELGPQVAIELAGSKELIRCRACGRILYLEDMIKGE